MKTPSLGGTNCWKEAGGKEPRQMSQSTGRSFKFKRPGVGKQEADDCDVGKYNKIMNFRGKNSQYCCGLKWPTKSNVRLSEGCQKLWS